jgi:hypothetical protein
VYVGVTALVVAVTALRGDWGKQELTAKTTAAATTAHTLSADLGRERARTRP